MDRLRALEYFVAAAEEGSLSAAARHYDVSVQAVARLVAALERSLGAPLFERHSQGLTLTSVGRGYLAACRPLLEEFLAVDEAVRGAKDRPRGTIVIGATTFTAQHCLVPALPHFRARYPEIDIDLRTVTKPADADAAECEVLLLHGWHEALDWVCIALPLLLPLVTVASPAYWSAHEMPLRPEDLARHECLCYRNPYGTCLDVWRFQRADVVETVKVNGWLTSNHRDHLVRAALDGQGIVRTMRATIPNELQAGRLVPALLDWTGLDAPPLTLMYRSAHRRLPRIQAFNAFATALFERIASADAHDYTSSPRPAWHRWPHERPPVGFRKA
jgi:DNA-binding transcriptional LysR family regulator